MVFIMMLLLDTTLEDDNKRAQLLYCQKLTVQMSLAVQSLLVRMHLKFKENSIVLDVGSGLETSMTDEPSPASCRVHLASWLGETLQIFFIHLSRI